MIAQVRTRSEPGFKTNFGLLFILGLDTQQSSEEEKINFQLCYWLVVLHDSEV